MTIKNFKPVTPGRRGGSVLDFSDLTKEAPEKKLTIGMKSTGGRNNLGRRTSNHRGGGHKRRFRIIDFRRDKYDIPAVVLSLQYDPLRSANIALLGYADGEKKYILAPEGLKPGMKVISSRSMVDAEIGCAMPLSVIPVGSVIHNIELTPGRGGQIVRSAGTQARLMSREEKHCTVRLPSGELRMIPSGCMATIGQTGNLDHGIRHIGKAGRNRWFGIRPSVRGIAQNPVSHPMGGGEGRSKSGQIPRSRTGVLAKGGKTRSHKKSSNKLILHRRK